VEEEIKLDVENPPASKRDNYYKNIKMNMD